MDRRTALGALAALRALPAAAGAMPLRQLSFNILAPLWADARWYPAALDPALLAADLRRARITAFLRAGGSK